MGDNTTLDETNLAPADLAGAADASTANGTVAAVAGSTTLETREVHLSVWMIRTDGGTQPRADIDRNIVAEYAADLNGGAEFPPVDLFYDGKHYWLADGFHRLLAHRQARCVVIRAVVRQGTRLDAQWLSYKANREQDCVGLRRTNADKERAVRAALAHRKGKTLSDLAIAEHVGVTDKTVAKYRAAMNSEIPSSHMRTDRNGRNFTVAKARKHRGKEDANSAPPTVAPAIELPTMTTTSESAAVAGNQEGPDEAATGSPQPVATDEVGRVIESREIVAAFACRAEFKSLMNEVSRLKNKFQGLTQISGGAWAVRHQQEFDADVNNLHAALRFSMPYAICPYCGGGKNCGPCKNTGWMPEKVYENVPSDIRGGKKL